MSIHPTQTSSSRSTPSVPHLAHPHPQPHISPYLLRTPHPHRLQLISHHLPIHPLRHDLQARDLQCMHPTRSRAADAICRLVGTANPNCAPAFPALFVLAMMTPSVSMSWPSAASSLVNAF